MKNSTFLLMLALVQSAFSLFVAFANVVTELEHVITCATLMITVVITLSAAFICATIEEKQV